MIQAKTAEERFIDLQNRGIQVLADKDYRWIYYDYFNH